MGFGGMPSAGASQGATCCTRAVRVSGCGLAGRGLQPRGIGSQELLSPKSTSSHPTAGKKCKAAVRQSEAARLLPVPPRPMGSVNKYLP